MGKVKQMLMDQQEAEAEQLRKLHPDWDDEQIHDEIHKDTRTQNDF